MTEASSDHSPGLSISFGHGGLSARFSNFEHDADQGNCPLCLYQGSPDLETQNILDELRDFWRRNLDSTNLHALAANSVELISRHGDVLEDFANLTPETILSHFTHHTCDALQSHTVLNIANAYLSKAIVSITQSGLKDRAGKRVADGEAIKVLEKSMKMFQSMKTQRDIIIYSQKTLLR